MGKHRALLQRWQARRFIKPQEGAHTAYTLYETAWADAWPHLDDWFMPEAFFIWRGRCRPGIA